MKFSHTYRLLPALCLCLAFAVGTPGIVSASGSEKKQNARKTASKHSNKKKGGKKLPRETSAQVKKKEQSVNREIRLTQRQIEQNEEAVRQNLAILNTLELDIDAQNRRVADLHTREKQLNSDIGKCKADIGKCEDKLADLRTRYVATIKKMRIARKRANPLAYIFASGSFYQAWRRMRYMRKYSMWKERRETEIKGEIARLADLNNQLASGQKQLSINLKQQEQARQVLASKHSAQDEAVRNLRAHGDALREHLALKQAEANALSAQVMTLIAAEQEEARAAEQRRREAAARKAAAEKAAVEKATREREAREKAEAERAALQKAAAEKAAREQAEAQKKEAAQKKKQTAKADKTKKKPTQKKQTKKPESRKNESVKQPSGNEYAVARGRKPRKQQNDATAAPSTAPKTSSTGTARPAAEARPAPAPASAGHSGFAACKGSLPRPVSGNFSIYSRFGRHALPDLPDVMFDNPGIDAIVSAGASAQSVYDGTVTGVYVVPGYSTVVIICHGDYYTVYGNIGKPQVSKGQSVKQGQALGRLVSDDDAGGRTTIHFEIYKNREKLNPEQWIR